MIVATARRAASRMRAAHHWAYGPVIVGSARAIASSIFSSVPCRCVTTGTPGRASAAAS